MRAMSLLVPPISTEMRSSMPADDRAAADDAGGGPGQEQSDRTLARNAGDSYASARLHYLQWRGDACSFQPHLEVGEIAVDHRLDVGVERRDDRALILPEGRVDLRGQRNVGLRMSAADDFR